MKYKFWNPTQVWFYIQSKVVRRRWDGTFKNKLSLDNFKGILGIWFDGAEKIQFVWLEKYRESRETSYFHILWREKIYLI